jgi:hypothetical protein
MKKLLLSILICGFAVLANAQNRVIDLQALAIYGPDTIKHNQSFTVNSTFKNLGTDSLLPGDSIFLNVVLFNGGLVLPPSGSYYTILTSIVAPNDTFVQNFNTGIGIGYPNDTTLQVCVFGRAVNGTGVGPITPITAEDSSTILNNITCKTAYYRTNHTAISEIEAGSFNMFPNPANSAVTFNFTLASASEVAISIADVTGKVVASQSNGLQTAGSHSMNFDISNLAPGMYITHIQVGTTVKTQKLIISR